MFLQSTTGYTEVKQLGTGPTLTSSMPFADKGNRLIVIVVPVLSTVLVNGCGYLPETYVSDFPAKNSAQGTWVHFK